MDDAEELDPERKARVIHARVPEDLDRELKKKASRLGVSVSNLVRNVLQNAFGLVGDIVQDSADLARTARDPLPPEPPPARPPLILGWQTLTLNVNALCGSCNAILPRGTEAMVAVTEAGIGREFRCAPCAKGGTES